MEFRTFSQSLYGRAGVAPACLGLQDRRGLDVNLLLLCCWAGGQGRSLDREALAMLASAIGPWRANVVEPLRAVRRWLKANPESVAGAPDLRRRILDTEIEAERLAQGRLSSAVAESPAAAGREPLAAAAANLRAYLAMMGVAPGASEYADLAAILGGCFPDRAPAEITGLLG